jgi:hypothetical protein
MCVLNLKGAFPKLISYNRFVYLMKNLFVPLFAYLFHRRGVVTGIAFIDSTSIAVCHNKRIQRNKVFKGLAKRGKTTAGWFYGFKLHLIINDKGEILAFQLTPGNVADVAMVDTLSQRIFGKLLETRGIFQQNWQNPSYSVVWSCLQAIRSKMKQNL